MITTFRNRSSRIMKDKILKYGRLPSFKTGAFSKRCLCLEDRTMLFKRHWQKRSWFLYTGKRYNTSPSTWLCATISQVRLKTDIDKLTALRSLILFFPLSIQGQNDFRQKTQKIQFLWQQSASIILWKFAFTPRPQTREGRIITILPHTTLILLHSHKKNHPGTVQFDAAVHAEW